MEESYLCQRCRSVDWDAAFAPIPPKQWKDRIVLEFRSKLEIRQDDRCRLCLALASLFGPEDVKPTNKLDQRFALVAERSQTICKASPWRDEIYSSLPGFLTMEDKCPTWLIPLLIPKPIFEVRSPQLSVIVENRALERGESGYEFGLPRRTVDFDRLRSWLSDCRRRGPCARPLDLPGMRVIDCELREIVPLPAANPEYATLSYVWGQSEAPCSTDGKLPDRLPLTIEDSITVCQELGVRYLWVDRYCIQESHKHALIRSMHRIYHESQFTIVAAEGCGPDHGLPGVGSTPRSDTKVMDHPIRVGTRQLSCIKDIESYVSRSAQRTKNSRWAKRGWTFQEGILSKRLCVFLDDQVHLENGLEAQSERLRPCERTWLGPQSDFTSTERFWDIVSAFCSRDLSYPADALNAMSGILSTGTQNTRTFRHISGLALEDGGRHMLDDALLRSLAWRVLRAVPRRRGFPSWTWTGWMKPEIQHIDFVAAGTLFVLDSVETDNKDITNHAQLLDLLKVQHELLDSVKILHITAEVIDVCIGPSDSMPSIGQRLCGDQEPKSEWRVMIVLDGRETVYECEVTRLVTKDDTWLSISRQYIQCKGLVISRRWIDSRGRSSIVYDILVMVWDKAGGFYERFGIFSMPQSNSVKKKAETIRLG